jgi:hypothetical protein
LRFNTDLVNRHTNNCLLDFAGAELKFFNDLVSIPQTPFQAATSAAAPNAIDHQDAASPIGDPEASDCYVANFHHIRRNLGRRIINRVGSSNSRPLSLKVARAMEIGKPTRQDGDEQPGPRTQAPHEGPPALVVEARREARFRKNRTPTAAARQANDNKRIHRQSGQGGSLGGIGRDPDLRLPAIPNVVSVGFSGPVRFPSAST